VDEGAEAVWRPKTAWLITEAGLGDRFELAATTAAAIWTRGKLRQVPGRQFMGVPADMDELAATGLLSDDGMARAREELELPATARNGDVSVASFIGGRFGQEVVDRLIEPFLYEMCAGRAEELSFQTTLTPMAMASRKYASLAKAADALLPPTHPLASGICTLTGGLGTLPETLAEAVLAASPGAVVRTGATVTELTRGEHGWRVTVGSPAAPEHLDADAVILAVPAGGASRLLAGLPGAEPASAGLADIGYASVGVIMLAYPREAFAGGLAERGLCGYRVPAVDGRAVKSVTFSTVKWPHLAGREVEIVRCQAGGIGEEELLHRDDADLAALAASEVAEATGVTGAPVATRVTRWSQSLPQYTVGHQERVARIRTSVATQPGLAVCGAAYDGAGVGICMATARMAVTQVLTSLKDSAAPAAGRG
jgi:protoporphyrinogen/coproporphyrinogen III oxidase